MIINSDREDEEDDSRIIHVRFGIIVANNKHSRFVVVRIDTEDYPLVFLKERTDDDEYGYESYYMLYKAALTAKEADKILDLLKENDKRKANTLLKKYFKEEGVLCEFAGPARLDDAVPDAWYDVWKELEGPITFRRDFPGYYEIDVVEQNVF